MRKWSPLWIVICAASLLSLPGLSQSVTEVEKQKENAEQDIRETRAELNANEKKVNAGLATLRKLDDEITASKKEIETVKGQIDVINGNITSLEGSISTGEIELKALREEYLKAVKKMRVARKQNSGMAFLFSSSSFNEARRRMRYMQEFSEWKDRRSSEITGKVNTLREQRRQLAQARNDATIALNREKAAQSKLALQRGEQQEAVNELRANSDALRDKLARRQAEAKKLSNQISQLIAEQRAKEAREAEARKKAEEEKRLAEEKRVAEEKRLAEEKRIAEEKRLAEEKKKSEEKTPSSKSPAEEKQVAQKKPDKQPEQVEKSVSGDEYAEARKRRRTTTTAPTETPKPELAAGSGFEGMKGSLPKPVGGSFKLVSAFGVHPISPELPDIMDENLGIDAHVANGASAMAVYEGEVIKIYDRTNTPGFRNIVVLKHGDYITVYANLETLAVKTGQKVKQGQALGTVGADFDDPSFGMIHFEVWKNQTHLNPASWIKI